MWSVLKTGLEAMSSRQLPVLIKTGWKMSCCGQFLSRCLHKYKAVLIIKTTWWFWASFSSLPWRWLHNCLEALSSRQSTTTQKMPVFKPGLDFTTYMQTTWKLLSWRPTTTTGCKTESKTNETAEAVTFISVDQSSVGFKQHVSGKNEMGINSRRGWAVTYKYEYSKNGYS